MSMIESKTLNKDDSLVGWIGVGNLGEPICNNLMRSSINICVCDINPVQIDKLSEGGAIVANTPAEVAKQSQLVFSAIPSDEAPID
ncbi:MAG: NAD(P)-binding domain-containing protein [Methyloligellaceae bacterium]